jgi:nicotinamide N-methyltransferase
VPHVGTGLAGIVGALSGAEEVVISDHPTPEILANIKVNIEKNIPTHVQPKVSVQGHEWGNMTDPFAESRKGSFSRILAADCLWMPWQHENLIESMLHFLSYDNGARIWVIAGFHTGRAKLAPFFDIAVGKELAIEAIWERDCDGHEREWATERDGGREDAGERKKWLVLAILRRKPSSLLSTTDSSTHATP